MLHELTTMLHDQDLTWGQRRTRLQGWSGTDAELADAMPGAQRLAPAACAIGAVVGGLTGSVVVLTAFAATAAVGAFAANHPFEWLANRVAARRGRPELPANRAAKRLGCVIGATMLGAAAVAHLLGAPAAGTALALTLGSVAAFVAATGICVPSMLFTVVWGRARGQAPTLAAAAFGRGAGPVDLPVGGR